MAVKKISAREIAGDINAGMDESELAGNYGISSETLRGFTAQLKEAGLITGLQQHCLGRTGTGALRIDMPILRVQPRRAIAPDMLDVRRRCRMSVLLRSMAVPIIAPGFAESVRVLSTGAPGPCESCPRSIR
jgi:hypothetical protein